MFLGKIDENEFVTIGTFTFQKYFNNDGAIVNGVEISADGLKNVEAFVHYTYNKSEGNLMVLDIQALSITYCVTLKLLQKTK